MKSLVRVIGPRCPIGAPCLFSSAVNRAGCMHPLTHRRRGAELTEHALEDRRRQAIPTVGEGFEGQRDPITGQAGMQDPGMTGIDSIHKARRTHRARDKQATCHSRHNEERRDEERRDEAEEEHDEAAMTMATMTTAVTSGMPTTAHARFANTRTSRPHLGTRGAPPRARPPRSSSAEAQSARTQPAVRLHSPPSDSRRASSCDASRDGRERRDADRPQRTPRPRPDVRIPAQGRKVPHGAAPARGQRLARHHCAVSA